MNPSGGDLHGLGLWKMKSKTRSCVKINALWLDSFSTTHHPPPTLRIRQRLAKNSAVAKSCLSSLDKRSEVEPVLASTTLGFVHARPKRSNREAAPSFLTRKTLWEEPLTHSLRQPVRLSKQHLALPFDAHDPVTSIHRMTCITTLFVTPDNVSA